MRHRAETPVGDALRTGRSRRWHGPRRRPFGSGRLLAVKSQREATPLSELHTAIILRVVLVAVFVAFAAAIGMSLGGLALFALSLPVALIAGVAGLALWRRGHRRATALIGALALLASVGTGVGFVEIAELPDGPITVRATAVRAQKSVRWPEITVPTELTQPNGPDCGGGARQAEVTITAQGLR